jgi:drug/metabolite transporter (DMT)-like permease
MAAFLALFSSFLWGGADFFGGLLAKRYKSIAVTATSQFFGLVLGTLLVIVSGTYIAPNLSWNSYLIPGMLAGTFGLIGLVAFYAGLATGKMGVVSPISSLSALIPITVAFINGEKPNSQQLIGMTIALMGAFFASGPELKGRITLQPILFALVALVGFGTALTFLTQGSKTNALLTMTTMRLTTVSICLIIAIRIKVFGGFDRKDYPVIILIGIADFLGNFLLGLATTKGLISLAIVLGSLFPIITSLLAFRFLHERLHRIQYLGIAQAITGVVLISLA